MRQQGILQFSVVLTLCAMMLSLPGCASARGTTRQAFLLNTIVRITLYDAPEECFDACFAIIRASEKELSRTDPDSELARLNARLTDTVSPETAAVIEAALTLAVKTDGAFDPTVGALCACWDFSGENPHVPPNEKIEAALRGVGYAGVTVEGERVSFASDETWLDLGAIAKGEIADRVSAYLRGAGISRAILNLGGNVTVLGGSQPYRVGVQDPASASGTSLLTLRTCDASVVTSGIYERGFTEHGIYYHHILDPSTGYPCNNELASATVIGPSDDSRSCDAMSTACMLLGAERGMELVEASGFDAVFILRSGEVRMSTGAEQKYHIQMRKEAGT